MVARRLEVSGVRRGWVKSLVGLEEARVSHILRNLSSEFVKKMLGSLEEGECGVRRGAIELIEVLWPMRVRYSTDWIGDSGFTPFAAFFLARWEVSIFVDESLLRIILFILLRIFIAKREPHQTFQDKII